MNERTLEAIGAVGGTITGLGLAAIFYLGVPALCHQVEKSKGYVHLPINTHSFSQTPMAYRSEGSREYDMVKVRIASPKGIWQYDRPITPEEKIQVGKSLSAQNSKRN